MTTQTASTPRIFIGCFEFINQETLDDGTFQIAIEASGVEEAIMKCRARLDEIADSSDNFGPVAVYMNALVELGREALARGTYFNLTKTDVGEDCTVHDALPDQGSRGSDVHYWEDMGSESAATPSTAAYDIKSTSDDADGGREDVPIFWNGVEDFNKKLKLYWCETDDHDEDWFVIARNEQDAAEFFTDYEGYDEEDATPTLVCVLPASEQGRYNGASWPEDDTLIACGGEFLPLVTQDGADAIRRMAGSGSRAVRLKGNVYSEGDIVGNVMNRMGIVEQS